jgi:hypothetical protein
MNALVRGTLFIALVAQFALGSSLTYAQTLLPNGDAPGAEAAGAADAANRAANGGAFKAGADDAKLLGGPAAYGDTDEPRLPAAGANGQAQGATPLEHMLDNPDAPQQGANPKLVKAAAQPPAGNAALQLYGNGAARGATPQTIYKSPW